jgi:hypothetical protein
MIINSQIQLGKILNTFNKEEIKNEPMFFRATREFAYNNGGALTKMFLDNLEAPENIIKEKS